MRGDTREKIIASAMKHLYQLGYNRFSFAPVAEDCDIAKAGIHYYFPTKDDLALAAIDKYTAEEKVVLDAIVGDDKLSAPDKFNAIFNHFRERMIKRNYIGCLAGNLGLEVSETNQAIRNRINNFIDYKLHIFAELIESGKKNGQFNTDANAPALAQAIFFSLEGGVMTSKISKSPVLLASAFHVCSNLVSNMCVTPKTRRGRK